MRVPRKLKKATRHLEIQRPIDSLLQIPEIRGNKMIIRDLSKIVVKDNYRRTKWILRAINEIRRENVRIYKRMIDNMTNESAQRSAINLNFRCLEK